jgi:hypothetical protein
LKHVYEVNALVLAMGERKELEESPTMTDAGARPTPRPSLRVLGRYEIAAKLGEGGMGIVYRARDPALARDVALKLVSGVETPERVHRLLREAQAMAQVKHENLVAIYDVVEAKEGICLAMELVDGTTLRAWLAESRPWRTKLAAVMAAGRGLAAAHARGVVHRDFKPENALVARDGTVKVVDFGLACADPGSETPRISDLDLTRTGALIGTPAYMAPEQHAGAIADARSDQFALAVTAWEALFGERPFRGATYAELAAAVRAGSIATPSSNVPRRIERVLRRALALEPDARYASVVELLGELERALRRPRWPYLAAGALGSAIAIAVGWPTHAQETRAQPPARVTMATAGAQDDLGLAIRSVIKSHIAEIQGCFERSGQPGGTVAIHFTISAAGKVTAVSITDDGFKDGAVAGCIASLAFTWVFPLPEPHGEIVVEYPFTFRAMAP